MPGSSGPIRSDSGHAPRAANIPACDHGPARFTGLYRLANPFICHEREMSRLCPRNRISSGVQSGEHESQARLSVSPSRERAAPVHDETASPPCTIDGQSRGQRGVSSVHEFKPRFDGLDRPTYPGARGRPGGVEGHGCAGRAGGRPAPSGRLR
jgi:hypothetical protein